MSIERVRLQYLFDRGVRMKSLSTLRFSEALTLHKHGDSLCADLSDAAEVLQDQLSDSKLTLLPWSPILP